MDGGPLKPESGLRDVSQVIKRLPLMLGGIVRDYAGAFAATPARNAFKWCDC